MMKVTSIQRAVTRGSIPALAENGVEIVSTETFQSGDTDFSTQLTRIMEANPEAIFIATLPPEMPLILSQGRELGIPDSVPFIIPEIAIEQVAAAGTAAEGVITFIGWSSLAATPGNEAFIQSYTEKYGMDRTLGRRNRMRHSIFSLRRLWRRNPPIQPQFGTRWRILWIWTPF